MTGGIIQQMAAPGVETIVGVVDHPLFGPLVMFGMGGTATELLGDRSFRILPVTDLDAAELVRSLRASPLLFGYRGSPPVAVSALEDVLQRIARLAGRRARPRGARHQPAHRLARGRHRCRRPSEGRRSGHMTPPVLSSQPASSMRSANRWK